MTFAIGYDSLQVFPFELERIQEFKLIQKINDHTRLILSGIIKEEKKDIYVAMTTLQTPIKVMNISPMDTSNEAMQGNDANTLFIGLVTKIEVKCIQGVYHLNIEAASYTYLLDLIEHKRSYQDVTLTYEELMRKIIENYAQADIIFAADESIVTGQFIMQYEETDWEFIKRMASRFNTGLVPASTYDAPKFFFGILQGLPTEIIEMDTFHNYTVEKDIKKWLSLALAYTPDVQSDEFLNYRIHSKKMLAIGQKVIFKGEVLYVAEIVSVMEDGTLMNYHTLSKEAALYKDIIYNSKIIGASAQGSVIDIQREYVKVHLYIDEKQDKEKACWMPWATMYGSSHDSGWYCMPELGDKVRIYFPNAMESQGFVINSAYKEIPFIVKPENKSKSPYALDRDRLANPDIISFRNLFGKELIFAPDRVIIHSDGVHIILNDADGVEIYTVNNIDIISQEKISIKAAEIEITGEEKVTINSPKIKLSGTEIKIN